MNVVMKPRNVFESQRLGMVYRVTDLIDRVEAQVYEHDDRYTVSLVDLDSGETAGTVTYRYNGNQSVALTKASEKANHWCAPLPVTLARMSEGVPVQEMRLAILTQYKENYGAHDWDGDGECPQYWKSKGGYWYVIEGIPEGVSAFEALALARTVIEADNDYFKEYPVHHEELIDGGKDPWDEWEKPKRISWGALNADLEKISGKDFQGGVM